MSNYNQVALVVGHSPRRKGARNRKSQETEFGYNDSLVHSIHHALPRITIPVYRTSTYSYLPYQINRLNPDVIISFHCNSFDTTVSGTEMLYYHNSVLGQAYAQIIQHEVVSALNLPDRGWKRCTRWNRGGWILSRTWAPCIIAESFFIDNDKDLQIGITRIHSLRDAYIGAIEQILEGS